MTPNGMPRITLQSGGMGATSQVHRWKMRLSLKEPLVPCSNQAMSKSNKRDTQEMTKTKVDQESMILRQCTIHLTQNSIHLPHPKVVLG